MKIGIFYICTGKYSIFWKGFFDSCEQFFLPQVEKKYYVFTDASDIQDTNNIKTYYTQSKGFPYDSLLRFDMFIRAEEDTKECDYVFFFNSNMEFKKVVTPEMFLPTAEDNGLLGVLHPGHYYKHNPISLPYEKRKRSTAYIKYTKGETYHYFMGGVNGGTHEAFYRLSHVCSENIKKDLDRNCIAIYHDESHLNRYFHNKKIKILPPSFGFPEGGNIPFEPYIIIRNKMKHGGKYFDKLPTTAYVQRIKRRIKELYRNILWILNF